MATAESTLSGKSPAEAALSELALSLVILASQATEDPEAVKQVSRGFREMASLARTMGKTRFLMASRASALAGVLDRLDKSPENDAEFIIDTVINFLESIRCCHDARMSAAMA